jgi:hypothetical protein
MITPHRTPIRNVRLILLLMSRRLVFYFHCASGRFCCATQELYFAPSFARLFFLHCPFTKDRSSPPSRFLAPATDGRSFDVQALSAPLWLNFRPLEKSLVGSIAPAVLAPRVACLLLAIHTRSGSLKAGPALQTLHQWVHLSQSVYPYLSMPDDGGIKDIPAFIAVAVT